MISDETRGRILSVFNDFSPKKIILFGSACRMSDLEAGDLDLIVVYDTPKRFLDRLKELYEHWDLPKAVDILAYTPEEFDRLMLENHFVIDAVQHGVLLYDAAA
jgi:predicted nucleotidyltransferase